MNKFILNAYPRGADYQGVIANHCDDPFKSVTVDLNGDCFLCKCDAWLPMSVGNILDFSKLEDIWNNPTAKLLQQTITDRTYTYCAVNHCGILNNNLTRSKYYINFSVDDSCNLACPTCRRGLINYTSGEKFDLKLSQVNHFIELLNKFEQPTDIILTGNGDPLASLIMRPLILNWQPKANQNIILFTNGLLIKKLLANSPVLPNISRFQISVDAGSKEVYEVVRAPGKFSNLIDNLEWLAVNRRQNVNIVLKFVLSSMNANDVENFSTLCKKYGFNGEISKLDNWATFDNFTEYDVIGNTNHPLHKTAIEQLRKIANEPHLFIGPILRNLL